ncbi:cell death abnormality protein 1-like isoform X2 [Haliotis rufescens]|uniref:cell death abnormality protein 1-like isoform X2 n=1 Tax=Haliotis rufescens TaxID=6454 RepID=UPI00201EADA3|nr:cell death abnormality protein 1-like isoform X2 [Haliotis rufescens]
MDGCRLILYVVLWSVVVGTQNRQCPAGFYGSSCQHTCPMTCNNKQCNIDKFGRTVCTHGCVDGYRGTSCRIPCPVNCQVCERLNGSCINCKDTFHGTNCSLTCEELCQGFRCDTDQTCSKTTCLDGWYGQNCRNKCYPRCLTCTQSTGNCTACGDGYYGEFCGLDCPRCGFTDGSVDQTCKDGCNTTSCSDIKRGESGNNILLYVFIAIAVLLFLLLGIVIAVLLFLLLGSRYTIIRKKKEALGGVELQLLTRRNGGSVISVTDSKQPNIDDGYSSWKLKKNATV